MKTAIVIALALSGFGFGCASTRTPSQLTDARVAFQHAERSPGAGLVATEMGQARQALDDAERTFAKDGASAEAQNLAYIAQRKAISAQARGEIARAMENKRVAWGEYVRARDEQAMAARGELDLGKGGKLSIAQQEAAAQRQARTAVQAKLEEIDGLQATKTERGTTMTLASATAFASGRSELLPQAKTKLAGIATALKGDPRTLDVIAYTDPRDHANAQLGAARAAAVRAYLVSRGFAEARVRSETRPHGEGATAAGPIEIVVEDRPPATPLKP